MSLNPKALLQKVAQNKKVFFPFLAGFLAVFFLVSFIKDHISCVGGFPVYKKTKKEIVRPEAEGLPVPVKVYKVARVSFRDTLPTLGAMRGFREIDLKFPASGVVEYLNFREGESITQGDIIASLDQKEALLKLEYAKVELEKQTKLYELGSIVETKLKQSQLEYQSAKAELEKTNLVALSDGYVGSLSMDRGSYVTPQDKIGTFVDMRDVYVDFGIIEKDIGKVREGQNVEVTVDAYPDQIFKGQVDSVSPLVEGRSRTLKVRSKISNPDEKLKPGMFGRVHVLVYEKEEALVIPSSSFKKKEDQYIVYLVHPEEGPPSAGSPPRRAKKSKARKKTSEPEFTPQESKPLLGSVELRSIEVQYATPDALEVKEGLEEEDLVIVDPEQDFQDKAKVEISETQEGIF